MNSANKSVFLLAITLITATVSCTAAPGVTPSTQTSIVEQASNTDANGSIVATDAPMLTETPTVTSTPTITQTPTPPPDVELAQLQVIDKSFFIAEIINHLSTPVVFEDQQPAFRFDVYDPGLDKHYQGEESVDRYNDETTIPCVLYPGEMAFYEGTARAMLNEWKSTGYHSPSDQLRINYQVLSIPRPDWPEKTRKYTVWDVKWDAEGEFLYFSFQHTPYHVTYGHSPFSQGTMGLYDKDNHLLGVATGSIFSTLDTGIADDYWTSFNNTSRGITTKGWLFIGPEEARTQVDHIAIMIEILPDIDGTCVKRPSTPTP